MTTHVKWPNFRGKNSLLLNVQPLYIDRATETMWQELVCSKYIKVYKLPVKTLNMGSIQLWPQIKTSRERAMTVRWRINVRWPLSSFPENNKKSKDYLWFIGYEFWKMKYTCQNQFPSEEAGSDFYVQSKNCRLKGVPHKILDAVEQFHGHF